MGHLEVGEDGGQVARPVLKPLLRQHLVLQGRSLKLEASRLKPEQSEITFTHRLTALAGSCQSNTLHCSRNISKLSVPHSTGVSGLMSRETGKALVWATHRAAMSQ